MHATPKQKTTLALLKIYTKRGREDQVVGVIGR